MSAAIRETERDRTDHESAPYNSRIQSGAKCKTHTHEVSIEYLH
jgi:hypothetical protein